MRAGTNTVAFRIQPNAPRKNLTMGWIDWLQPPPDENMGIVRDVLVRRGGPVALRAAHVVTGLDVPSLSTADLTVKARVRDSDSPVTTTVSGGIGAISFSKSLSLAAHATKTVTFTPAEVPGLHLTSPKVWWPAGMGGQPLYALDLTASVVGTVSDAAHENFGIRDVKAPLNSDGARQYSVNGRKLLIRGGGWSPDEFLRWDRGGGVGGSAAVAGESCPGSAFQTVLVRATVSARCSSAAVLPWMAVAISSTWALLRQSGMRPSIARIASCR